MQQVDVCPSEGLAEKTGKFAYWWHFMHVLSVVEYYTCRWARLPGRNTFPGMS